MLQSLHTSILFHFFLNDVKFSSCSSWFNSWSADEQVVTLGLPWVKEQTRHWPVLALSNESHFPLFVSVTSVTQVKLGRSLPEYDGLSPMMKLRQVDVCLASKQEDLSQSTCSIRELLIERRFGAVVQIRSSPKRS